MACSLWDAFVCPHLWAWIIIAVRHYHCDVITVIMWKTPGLLLATVPLPQGRCIARVSSSVLVAYTPSPVTVNWHRICIQSVAGE